MYYSHLIRANAADQNMASYWRVQMCNIALASSLTRMNLLPLRLYSVVEMLQHNRDEETLSVNWLSGHLLTSHMLLAFFTYTYKNICW